MIINYVFKQRIISNDVPIELCISAESISSIYLTVSVQCVIIYMNQTVLLLYMFQHNILVPRVNILCSGLQLQLHSF